MTAAEPTQKNFLTRGINHRGIQRRNGESRDVSTARASPGFIVVDEHEPIRREARMKGKPQNAVERFMVFAKVQHEDGTRRRRPRVERPEPPDLVRNHQPVRPRLERQIHRMLEGEGWVNAFDRIRRRRVGRSGNVVGRPRRSPEDHRGSQCQTANAKGQGEGEHTSRTTNPYCIA
jgi:hypothetical protein